MEAKFDNLEITIFYSLNTSAIGNEANYDPVTI